MLLASILAGCSETVDVAPSISASAQSTASPASPSASPSPTPLAQPLHVPLTTPVILYHDPVNPDQVDGITWDGTASGRVAASGAKLGFIPNPGGTLYATLADRGIYDRSGHLVGSYGGNMKGFGTWADDEHHYCQMVGKSATPPASGEPATLQVGAPGETTRTVAQVGTVGLQSTIAVAACSELSDRAVVVQSGGQGIGARQLWVVQLSTGRVLWTRSYLSDSTSSVTIGASRDGQYITEAHSGAGQTPGTTVYSPTGSVLGRLTMFVASFSWDGTLAVVTSPEGSVSVIRWRDGSHLWGAPQGQTLDAAMPEPGGLRVAVSLRNPDYQQTTGFPPTDLYVIGSDGQAAPLLQKVVL
jgi:hypothetical protein